MAMAPGRDVREDPGQTELEVADVEPLLAIVPTALKARGPSELVVEI